MELTAKDLESIKIDIKLAPAKTPAPVKKTTAPVTKTPAPVITPAPVKAEAETPAPVITPAPVTREPESNFWKILGIVGLILLIGLALVGLSRLFGWGTNSVAADANANPPAVVPVAESELAHLAYWSSATEKDRWPDMSQFDIVACHNDPDADGNASVVFLIGDDIKTSDLKLTYYNGYSGEWNDAVKNQIITEIQDSVRPHVPGFTLNKVDVTNISN